MELHQPLDLKNNTLQNAVVDADTNTLSNLTTANLKTGVLDTDLTDHTTIPTALAVKNS